MKLNKFQIERIKAGLDPKGGIVRMSVSRDELADLCDLALSALEPGTEGALSKAVREYLDWRNADTAGDETDVRKAYENMVRVYWASLSAPAPKVDLGKVREIAEKLKYCRDESVDFLVDELNKALLASEKGEGG